MGVDHECIFAYGFLLHPFDKKKDHTYDKLEKFIDDITNGKDIIRFATDGYYDDVVFVYIRTKDNAGFECGNRGYNTFSKETSDISKNSITFKVEDEDIQILQKVFEGYKQYICNEKIGWRPFNYSH